MLAFSVFDKKASSFATPFFVQTRGVAMRSFSDLANDQRSVVAQHPEDFALYEIGNFDETGGVLLHRVNEGGEALPPLFIAEASDFVKQETLK